MIVASHQGTYFADPGASEGVAKSFEKSSRDAFQATFGSHLNGKDPTARRFPKFPGANLTENESFDTAILFGNKQEPGRPPTQTEARKHLLPVMTFGETGDFLIERNQGRCVCSNGWADKKPICRARNRTRLHDRNMCRSMCLSRRQCSLPLLRTQGGLDRCPRVFDCNPECAAHHYQG